MPYFLGRPLFFDRLRLEIGHIIFLALTITVTKGSLIFKDQTEFTRSKTLFEAKRHLTQERSAVDGAETIPEP